ncbi:MAG: glycosyltransferase N-terminal domain-containing protein [Phycisphaerales bacterium]
MRKKRGGWDQRFGYVGSMVARDPAGSRRPRVMLHAVSVGEVNALRTLVPLLAQKADVVVSTTTDTGLTRARSLYGEAEGVEVVRYPLDCSWMVRRFLDTVRPDVVGLVELEVWPNFIKACTQRGIPVGLINGRLSARSYKGYRRLRPLLRPTFRRLAFACVQDRDYAQRIGAMGVPADRVSITGSMKWDSVDPGRHEGPSAKALQIAADMGVDLDRPIVVAGSTGPGEEAMLHGAVASDVQLIAAPRKVERFDEAAAAMPGCVRRSRSESKPGAKRFLLDTIGELSSVYELADVVVIGRSFGDLYGSDPIEPAAMGKAVLIGPAHSDFQRIIEPLKAAGGIAVIEPPDLASPIAGLLSDASRRQEMGERARDCVRAQQGASARHLEVLMRHCPADAPGSGKRPEVGMDRG